MDGTKRIFAGFCLLIAIWVAVYWAYDPTGAPSPPITFDEQPGAEDTTAGASGAEPPPDVAGREGTFPPETEPGTAGPTVIPPRFKQYTVGRNETFESIAGREFGSRALWTVIASANPLKDPGRLREGDEIRIPVDPENVQGQVAAEPDGAPQPPPAPEPEVILYQVKPRDTLSDIAQSFYGSSAPRYIDLIYEANRDVMPDRNTLREGWKLRIPPAPGGGGD